MDQLSAWSIAYPELHDVDLFLKFFLEVDRRGVVSDDGLFTRRDFREALDSIDYKSQYISIYSVISRSISFISSSDVLNLSQYMLLMSNVSKLAPLPPSPRNQQFENNLSTILDKYHISSTNDFLNVKGERSPWGEFFEAMYHYMPGRSATDREFVIRMAYIVANMKLVSTSELSLPLSPAQTPQPTVVKPSTMSDTDFTKWLQFWDKYAHNYIFGPLDLTVFESELLDRSITDTLTIKILNSLTLPATMQSFIDQVAVLLQKYTPSPTTPIVPPSSAPASKPAGWKQPPCVTLQVFEYFRDLFNAMDPAGNGILTRAQFRSGGEPTLVKIENMPWETLDREAYMNYVEKFEGTLCVQIWTPKLDETFFRTILLSLQLE